MKAWVRGLIALALVLLLAAGSAVAYVSYRSAQKLVHPERLLPTATPADVGLGFERISFASADAARIPLVGWWIPADHAKGVVVFLHGYGEDKNQSLGIAPFLHNDSYDVLAFDFRAHGESGGDLTTVGLDEIADVRAAIAYAKAKDTNASAHLALMGFSMGAATALNTAPLEPEVQAIVSDSAFATLQNIASHSITHFTGLPKYPFGPLAVTFASWIAHENVRDNAPVKAIAREKAPVLVIQGLADDIAYPKEDGEAIAAAAPPGSQLWEVPGARHVTAHDLAKAEYERRVTQFLDEHLSG